MGQAQQKRRAILIVEDDAELRHLTAALFEDEQMDTIECESAEAALATLLIGGREVTMIFADVRLRGLMNGIDLAREVKMRWPLLPVILTSGHPRERVGELPPGVGYMPKPWQPLNVLMAAEQALAFGREQLMAKRHLVTLSPSSASNRDDASGASGEGNAPQTRSNGERNRLRLQRAPNTAPPEALP